MQVLLNLFYSNRDVYGNVYWAFTAENAETGKSVSGTISGSESNIRAAEYWMRGRYPTGKEPCWRVHIEGLPIRQWNRMTKGWPYAGCTGQEILKFIQQTQ